MDFSSDDFAHFVIMVRALIPAVRFAQVAFAGLNRMERTRGLDA